MVTYESLKTEEKRKVQFANPKSGCSCLRELFITKFKRGFTKVVVTGAGRLREWSQGEHRLYLVKPYQAHSSCFEIS